MSGSGKDGAMTTEERDELFRLVMRYHDGELPASERAEVQARIDDSPEARAWLADMEAMGNATYEYVREAVHEEDFSEYWVTIDEGVRSPTPGLRQRKREADQAGLGGWLRRHLGTWLVPAGGLAVAGAAAVLVLAVGIPWATRDSAQQFSSADWTDIAAVDNTLEIDDIAGDDWAVSILSAGVDQPMIIWLDDTQGDGGQG
jgi:anti-sigma factor RsiW